MSTTATVLNGWTWSCPMQTDDKVGEKNMTWRKKHTRTDTPLMEAPEDSTS